MLNKFSSTCIARFSFSFTYNISLSVLNAVPATWIRRAYLLLLFPTVGELHEGVFYSCAMSFKNLLFKRLQGCKVI